ncbi:malate dehydrogenase [Caminibacter pacificus]|jgi:malate dehydrogenase|uniref:Malate dehydrogenase n=1 Tax=Caminibacter pacificus TaxID=1424653 RepID=A0AAJ4REG7_9BACT|nr:malate dehydrogenase [Caminibacter pacificus]NPA87798.1 malate dehydrogenase [Campylobacterota bacterium]QCI28185.1 malate dehydrogenase [Caminibacter pacificus]ROR41101.1 malate dehydrogenase (NAD) [Caminibacter pacificus]
MSNKVSIIGAGNVGSIVGYSLAMQGLAHEIILVDRDTDRAKGKALDMSHAASAVRSHSIVRAAESYEDVRGSKVVVITAGFPRKPGMTREDLLLKNAEIMKDVITNVKEVAPDAIIITVSNPLDAMTYTALRVGGFPRNQVIGMAGILDSARMAYFIYEKLGYGAGQIRASVIGGHGDFMVPLPRYSTVAGVPLSDLLTQKEIEEVVERTRHAGAEIVGYLKTGSAYFAPGKSTAIMVEAILKDSKQIFPCAVLLDGEYEVEGVVNGVPVMLGKDGAEKVIEVTLDPCEKEQFRRSTAAVKEMIDVLERDFFKENK